MALASPAAKALEDAARPKLVLALHGQLLDSKRNAPDAQLDCVSTLLKILKGVHDNPSEEKFRRIRCSTNAFKKVSSVKGGEEYLQAAGWARKVIDYEPWYTLDPAACGNYVTGLALKLLEDSLADTQAKKERYEKERWLKKNEAGLRKEEVLRSIEDDKRRRAEAAERTAAQQAAAAAAAAASGAAGGSGGLASPRGGLASPRAIAGGGGPPPAITDGSGDGHGGGGGAAGVND